MYQWVYERTNEARFVDKTVVATDNQKIYEDAYDKNIPIIMTRKHESGTDRVCEAACKLGAKPNDLILNVQGDEPCIRSDVLDALIYTHKKKNWEVSTLASQIDMYHAKQPNTVKVVCNEKGRALYFSRSVIPYQNPNITPISELMPILGHIGVYLFTMKYLARFTELETPGIERVERLEQLRLLFFGIPIYVLQTIYEPLGVDLPEDIKVVEKVLQQDT